MAYLLIIALVGFLLLPISFLNLHKKRLNTRLFEEIKKKDIDRKSKCKKIENCWCTEYDCDEENIGEVLKEYGDHNCGKTINSILNK